MPACASEHPMQKCAAARSMRKCACRSRGSRKGKLLPAAAVLLTAVFLSGCQKDVSYMTDSGFYFDTVISIQIEAEKTQGEALLDECFSLCASMENIFSRTNETSELYRINHRTKKSVEVSPDMAALIRTGLEYGEKTDGKLDIAVGGLSELWDFHSETPVIPDKTAIEAALPHVDYRTISLTGSTLTITDDQTKLDLGALAKGYIADQLKSLLLERGVTSGVINLGGNVLAIGKKNGETPWTVGIQKPFAADGELIKTIPTVDRSVVSSGIYERYFQKDGTLYHHILDPDTGYPVSDPLWQVTILSDDSLTGDALSTSSLLLGEEKAKALLSQYSDVEAFFVEKDNVMVTISNPAVSAAETP